MKFCLTLFILFAALSTACHPGSTYAPLNYSDTMLSFYQEDVARSQKLINDHQSEISKLHSNDGIHDEERICFLKKRISFLQSFIEEQENNIRMLEVIMLYDSIWSQ
jgi:peptidoglycan hydrolase CwlO-like protein